MNEPSYWFREVPDEKRFPVLEKNVRVEAAIIGGGIAGLSACYFLARAGIKTVLLEQGTLGSGDSGFTTAFATHFLDNPEATIRAWNASRDGIRLLKEVIGKEKIDCDWQDVPSSGFTLSEDTSHIQGDFRKFQSADPSLLYREGKEASDLLGLTATALYRKENEGQFHIRKFLVGLAAASAGAGAEIFEESGVSAIEQGSPIRLRTSQGSISADWLVVAAGFPPRAFFPALSGLLHGVITYVLHVRTRDKKTFSRSLFWDDAKPYHYFRWLNEEELAIGGEDHALREKPGRKPHEALEEWLRMIAGGTQFDIINKWQGSIFYSPDFLPYVSSHEAYGKRTIFLTGFGGNGMSHGLLAGKMAADIIQNKENHHADLFSFKRSA